MCNTSNAAPSQREFAIGTYVKDDDNEKYKVVGYSSTGQVIAEDADGDVSSFDQDDLDAWTSRDTRRFGGEAEATPAQVSVAFNTTRFVNLYEGNRVGSLVNDRYKADSNSRRSRCKRIAVGKVTINKAANGDFVASVSVEKVA